MISDADFEPDEVLVRITAASPQPIANRLIQTFGLVTLSRTQLTMIGTSLYRFRVPKGRTVEDVVADLAQVPGVAGAQPNWRYRLNTEAVHTGAAHASSRSIPQYALDMIGAHQAHTLSRGANVLVAVIDTGVDATHPELDDAIAGQFNAFPSEPLKPDTHATAIAGIISARRELAGIAPDARILAVQAFTSAGDSNGGLGTSYRVTTGINWAMLKGARVVNMSFAGARADDLLSDLIDKGNEAGIIFIAAAGNGGPQARPAYPAALEKVIAVTAIDEARALYNHANVGAYIDLAAPGVGIMTPAPGNLYDLASGTSFAAAHVSGVAALLLSTEPAMGRKKLLQQLKQTAADLGPAGPDEQFGAGCINANLALVNRTAGMGDGN